MESLEIVLEKGNRSYSEEEKLALAERKNRYYVDYLQELDHKAVLKDVMKTLILLRERGVKIGVGSASKNTPLIFGKDRAGALYR